MTQTQTLQCISTREAAELLTVARSTIYRMIERGELRSVKVGGRTVILKSDLADLLGRSAEIGRYEVDTAADGERLTRFYEYRGSRFVLVFTLTESHQDPTVTAIYRQ